MSTQYSDLFGPVNVPAAAAYDGSNKSWTYSYPDKLDRKRQAAISFITTPLHVPDVTDPVPDRSWAGWQPVRHTPAPGCYMRTPDFPAIFWPSFTPDVTNPVTAHSWSPNYPSKIYRKVRQTASTNWFLFTPPVVVVQGGVWLSTGQLNFLQYQDITGPVALPAPIGADQKTLKSVYADRVWPKRGLHAAYQQAYVSDRFDAPTALVVIPLSWKASYPDQHHAIRRNDSGLSFPLRTLTLPLPFPFEDAESLAKYPSSIAGKTNRAAYIWAQPMFGVEVPAPVMSWAGRFFGQKFPQRRAIQQSTQIPGFIPDVTDPVPSLSWKSVQTEWHLRRVRLLAAQHQLISILRAVTYPGADGCGVF